MLGCEIVEKSKIAFRARAPGRRNPHSSSSPGKPDTWQRGVGDPDGWNVEGCEMQTAETLLAIYGERGRHGRRKTLIVCERCHVAIHAGRPTRTHEDQEEPIKG